MDDSKVMISKPCFYGGEIKDILGPISLESLDKILDLLDEYDELVESSRPTT